MPNFILTETMTGEESAGKLAVLDTAKTVGAIRKKKEAVINARVDGPVLFGKKWNRNKLEKELEIYQKIE